MRHTGLPSQLAAPHGQRPNTACVLANAARAGGPRRPASSRSGAATAHGAVFDFARHSLSRAGAQASLLPSRRRSPFAAVPPLGAESPLAALAAESPLAALGAESPLAA